MTIKKYKFKFFDKEIEVADITVGQYIRILEEDETVFEEIFGKTGTLMCKRQQENAFKILLGGYEANELSELLKSKKKVNGEAIEGKHFYILEGKMMMALKQARSEIRSWEFLYFMKMYNSLDVVVGDRTYEDFKNHEKPDKKGLKNLLNNK